MLVQAINWIENRLDFYRCVYVTSLPLLLDLLGHLILGLGVGTDGSVALCVHLLDL